MRAYDPRDQEALERDDGVRERQTNQLALGRGPGSAPVHDDQREREPRERDRGPIDPLDAFSRDLDLPRGLDRELVRDRIRDYRLNASDTRTLSTVGAFRVVAERDLGNMRDASFDVRDRDLRELEKQGLTQRVPFGWT